MYVNESHVGAFVRRSNAFDTAEDLTAAVAVYGGMIVLKQCKIKRLMFVVTQDILAATVAPAVEFNRRPIIGSASGEVLLGTITIPSGTVAGKVMYKDIDEVVLYPGDELSFEHTVQTSDPGADTGAGFYGFEICDDPETVGNQSNMVASA